MNEENPFSSLPESWQEEIRRLRRENAKFRCERNQARQALAKLAVKVVAAA